MRLKAGKTEYDLPLDFAKISTVYIRAGKLFTSIYELPQQIPHNVDMSHIERAEKYRKDGLPKESVPAVYTVYPPKKNRKKSTIVFLPAPSKNWHVEIDYFSKRTA